LKYPPFPWAQNFQDGAHQTTGAQRKIFEKGTIFFGQLYNLKSSLQLNMFQELQIFAFVCTYWDAG
jgi:hypothetical protein